MSSRYLVGLAVLAALPILGQDYEIRLHRPRHVGQENKITVSGMETEETSMSSAGKVLQQEKKEFTVRLEGVLTVLATSTNGKVTRLSVQMGKFVKTEAGVTKDLLPPGTVVVASRGVRRTKFEVNGKALEADVARTLGVVVTVASKDLTDDEVFGTPDRKRVGDNWDVNSAAMAEMLNDDGSVAVKDVKGKVTLKEVVKDASGPLLHVTFELTGRTAVPPAPPGFSLREGTIGMKGTGDFPLDTKLTPRKETLEMTFSNRTVRKPNPNGAEVEQRMTAKRSMSATISPNK